jgi:Uma2 family endonuclease
MSTVPEKRWYTLQEYLAAEERSPIKHEFYRGEVFAMAGGTPQHNRIAGNIFARLHRFLEGTPCEPFGSDQRIRVPAADLTTYPDVSVVCGELALDPLDRHAITNPRVIFEVLSESTENYDRGPKFELYQKLDSLAEYIVVSQTEAKIIHYARQDNGSWLYRLIVGKEATLRLPSIDCELPLAAIYRGAELEPEIASAAAASSSESASSSQIVTPAETATQHR